MGLSIAPLDTGPVPESIGIPPPLMGRKRGAVSAPVVGAAYGRLEYEAIALARGPEVGCYVFYHTISINYF